MVSNITTTKKETHGNIANCRVVEIGNNIAECLKTGPNQCSFALPFGYCFLCEHPRLNEIIEKSKIGKTGK